MEQLLRVIGERVRTARKTLGLTQEALAERADLHVSYVGQIERGLREASLRSLQKVATALGLELNSLLAPAEPSTPFPAEFERVVGMVPENKRVAFLEVVRSLVRIVQ